MSTPPDLPPRPGEADELVRRFLEGTISRAEWTHPAHLYVCRHVLAEEPNTDAAFERMRTLIRTHNVRVDPEGGLAAYHDTITRYYVGAVNHAGAATDADLLADPGCQRDAALRYWSPEVLWSAEARDHWVDPDLAPFPWR